MVDQNRDAQMKTLLVNELAIAPNDLHPICNYDGLPITAEFIAQKVMALQADSALGTKKFGGTRSGVIGSTIGLVVGLITLGPFGIIIGSFGGAFFGELINDPTHKKAALKAAIGSLIGFISGFLLKLVTAMIFFFYYLKILWVNVN